MARQRSMWTGSISFGLVNVPVSLITATRDRDLHFHQIHAKTHERLSVSYVCTKEDRPVDYSEIAHGFDTGKGYVMLTDEELAAAQPEKTRTTSPRSTRSSSTIPTTSCPPARARARCGPTACWPT
jgi:Ku protein